MGLVRLFATLRKLANDQKSVEVPWTGGDPIGGVIGELVRLNPALDGQIIGEESDHRGGRSYPPLCWHISERKECTPLRRPANPGQ